MRAIDPNEDPMEEIDLGPCCICEQTGPDVRNMITLNRYAPVPGTGWGCVVCGLFPNGAIAVVCDACIRAHAAASPDGEPLEVKYVCYGYPAHGERMLISHLSSERFEHDLALHVEIDA